MSVPPGTRTHRRRLPAGITLVLAVLALASASCGPTTPGQGTTETAEPTPAVHAVDVYFAHVERGGPGDVFPVAREVGGVTPPAAAIDALLAGPTLDEQAAGYTSCFSPRTAGMLSSLRIVAGTGYVDLDPAIVGATDLVCAPEEVVAARASLDATMAQFDEVEAVRYSLGGEADAFGDWMARTHPGGGVAIEGPVHPERSEVPVPTEEPDDSPDPEPSPREDPTDETVREAQELLAALGYPVGPVDGLDGAQTRRGLCAWRRLEGHDVHRGPLRPGELEAIAVTSGLPAAPAGLGVTVDKTCQTLYQRDGGWWQQVHRASTGRGGLPHRGTYAIIYKRPGWHTSSLYPAPEPNMYNAMYFSGAIAIHGSNLVPTHPASAGCVRVTPASADVLFDQLQPGDPVTVIGSY